MIEDRDGYHQYESRHEAFLAYCRDHGFSPDDAAAASSFEDTMEQESADYMDDMRELARNGKE